VANVPAPFITFEGGEGAGKTTHIKLLAARLEASGANIILTREPGGSDGAEQLRSLLVEGATGRWSAAAEALLNYAARDSHLREKIRPALDAGQVVLCDRFMDSTRAYQGYAGGCDMAMIDAMEKAVVGKTRPDLTLVFDLDPEVGLERAKGRGDSAEDRFERKGLEFHQRLRKGFLAIAQANPRRCKVIDGALRIDQIERIIWREVINII
jgi:dTMP kinase